MKIADFLNELWKIKCYIYEPNSVQESFRYTPALWWFSWKVKPLTVSSVGNDDDNKSQMVKIKSVYGLA